MKLKKLVNNVWIVLVLTVVCTCLFAPTAKAEDPPMFVTAWGDSGTGPGQFMYPAGIAVSPTGEVYVTEYAQPRIQKFTEDGQFLGQFTTDYFHIPWMPAVSRSGDLFVTESSLDGSIRKYSSIGVVLKEWDFPDLGIEDSHLARGIAVSDSNYVYVAETQNSRVYKFTTNGDYVSQFTPNPDDTIPGIVNLACDGQGNIYITFNAKTETVTPSWVGKYSPAGNLLLRFGDTIGTGDGQFGGADGIVCDGNDAVYVVDQGNTRIQKFGTDGTFRTKWGTRGRGNGQFAFYPAGIALGNDGSIYVVDTGNFRIQKFRQNPNPITLSTFSAHREGSQVALHWEVNSVVAADVGFKIYRGNVDITGEPMHGQRRYEFIDAQAPREAVTYWLQEVGADGDSYRHGPITVPAADALTLNVAVRPNPFNPTTTIAFTVPERQPVSLSVYDAAGRLVATLIDHAAMEVGSYNIPYSHTGASGVYFARLTVGKKSQTQKLVCLK